jgi:hypothetical protein
MKFLPSADVWFVRYVTTMYQLDTSIRDKHDEKNIPFGEEERKPVDAVLVLLR